MIDSLVYRIGYHEKILLIILGYHKAIILLFLHYQCMDCYTFWCLVLGFPGGSGGEEPTCNVGDLGSSPGLGRSPGGRHGDPLQYYCLENPHGQRSLVGYGPWSHRVGHNWATKYSTHHKEITLLFLHYQCMDCYTFWCLVLVHTTTFCII